MWSIVKHCSSRPQCQMESERQVVLTTEMTLKSDDQIASVALKPGHKFITTLSEDANNTHEHVTQEVLVVDFKDVVAATSEVLKREQAKGPLKSESFYLLSLFKMLTTQSWLSYPLLDLLAYSTRSSPTWAFPIQHGRSTPGCRNLREEKRPSSSGRPRRVYSSVPMSLPEVSMSRV
jgi:hypothetical protein